eukprot:CAMPEP_0118721534 /NCGR_PEP_ID=MMETSP0800-20121206/30788_1 /TAXON_ID=210618 ORGANISM="Striatella unipunctata, Strain CCMP2910" /NCGR_SAMPLE_ID=MMETSP0800 /ASSEMBLY_ACC=CAM_ASM_000638 /LENGTH=578 /DNA_ID=CAMNT_0006629433 /DNA_START=41 /DNA_END=1778 /DNA_ORIENTATION=+
MAANTSTTTTHHSNGSSHNGHNNNGSEEERRAARRAALKAEAKEQGISYEELKAQKKAEKRKRDGGSGGGSGEEEEESAKRTKWKAVAAASPTPQAWRQQHSMVIVGHGENRGKEIPDPYMEFNQTPFGQTILQCFTRAGYERPTPIQSQAWSIASMNKDMICIAKTGSGKTCGFLLPFMHKHLSGGNSNGNHRGRRVPKLLVLAPTRELACQILEEATKFARPLGLRCVCCYGGAPKYPQIKSLEAGVDIIIATPGRLNDLIEMRKASLDGIMNVVLDEADRMLDMGFEPQIRAVLKHATQPHKQTMLFSATWPKEIQRLAFDFLVDPIQVNVGDVNSLVANKDITQHILVCAEAEKWDKLVAILKQLCGNSNNNTEGGDSNSAKQLHDKVIVFVAKKTTCNDLANRLWDDGFAVDALHGDRAQWERTKVMNAFKAGQLRILCATDVAARGLDVKDVAVVVNHDMPNAVEDYVHRIGRTGRAGSKGTSYSLFTAGNAKIANSLVEVLTKAEQQVPSELQAFVRPRHGRGGGGYYRSGGRGGGGGGGRGYMGRGGRGRGGGGGGRSWGGGGGNRGYFR